MLESTIICPNLPSTYQLSTHFVYWGVIFCLVSYAFIQISCLINTYWTNKRLRRQHGLSPSSYWRQSAVSSVWPNRHHLHRRQGFAQFCGGGNQWRLHRAQLCHQQQHRHLGVELQSSPNGRLALGFEVGRRQCDSFQHAECAPATGYFSNQRG